MTMGRKYNRHPGGLGNSIKKRMRIDETTGCWIWIFKPHSGGYGTISVNYKLWLAHRLSYHVFVEEIPDGLNVLHKCDNKMCVNPEHLFVGTQVQNLEDMIRKGRAPIRCQETGIFLKNERLEGGTKKPPRS
jgi:hypothetical protein